MILTGVLYFIVAIINSIVLVYALKLFCNLESSWRPSLRSRLTDQRASRYLEMHKLILLKKSQDAEQKPLIKEPKISAKQDEFKEGINKFLAEDGEQDVAEERKMIHNMEEEKKKKKKKKKKQKMPTKKKKVEYEKINQNE